VFRRLFVRPSDNGCSLRRRKGAIERASGKMVVVGAPAEIVAQTLDEQGANEEDAPQAEQPASEAPTPQAAEPVAPAVEVVAPKPKRSRSKKAPAAAA